MPRRELSEASASSTLSEVLSRVLILSERLEESRTPYPPPLPVNVLRHTLSVRSIVSISSSFAERMNAARGRDDQSFRVIGRGTCGTVFEVPGTVKAIKKGGNSHAIWTDFCLSTMVYNRWFEFRPLLEKRFSGKLVPRVPRCFGHIPIGDKTWWDTNSGRLPLNDRTPGAIYLIERILPLTKAAREALVHQFFLDDDKTRRKVLENPENRDCLVRLYLGMNSPERAVYDSSDTLRNFPLYLDQAKTIGLEVEQLAVEMAMGLAIVHWGTRIDGQDIEFVIGTSRSDGYLIEIPDYNSMTPQRIPEFKSRCTHLWMIDYDKCSEVDIENPSYSVQRFLVAVTGNDPYFPNPNLDTQLWTIFKQAYLEASYIILGSSENGQPLALLREWERWAEMDPGDAFDPFDRDSAGAGEEDEDDEDNDEESDEDSDEDIEEDSEEDSDEDSDRDGNKDSDRDGNKNSD